VKKPIRVLIVDDSLLIRQLFTKFLTNDPDIEVAGTACDPLEAREKIKKLNPDVLTLDIEMPKMDGLSFLEKIMKLRPMPVVMASSLTKRGADITLQALEMGAVDYVSKPQERDQLEKIGKELVMKVKAAARSRVQPNLAKTTTNLTYRGDAHKWLIAIGASTGGVEALRDVLSTMPADGPPIVITQHMPALFTSAFAKRLNGLCALEVLEATDGLPITSGHAYIAPGSTHLRVVRKGGRLTCEVKGNDLVSGHCPSVDVLFHSVAEACGKQAVGAILTGMGADGAQGLLAMRNAGAHTVGQSEASCVVYGMPKSAKAAGACSTEISLEHISSHLLTACK